MNRMTLISALLLVVIVVICVRMINRKPAVVVGGYYSALNGNRYSIIKILAVCEQGVHIRLYKYTWAERPSTVDEAALTVGAIDDEDGHGVGHLPYSFASLKGLEPKFIRQGTVSVEEREGYEIWKNEGGAGYW